MKSKLSSVYAAKAKTKKLSCGRLKGGLPGSSECYPIWRKERREAREKYFADIIKLRVLRWRGYPDRVNPKYNHMDANNR